VETEVYFGEPCAVSDPEDERPAGAGELARLEAVRGERQDLEAGAAGLAAPACRGSGRRGAGDAEAQRRAAAPTAPTASRRQAVAISPVLKVNMEGEMRGISLLSVR
jgi:hypothetical protein